MAIKMSDLKRKAEAENMDDVDWLFPGKQQHTSSDDTMQEWGELQRGTRVRMMESCIEMRLRFHAHNSRLNSRLREDNSEGEIEIDFTNQMEQFAGQVATVMASDAELQVFKLRIDNGGQAWFPYTTVTRMEAAPAPIRQRRVPFELRRELIRRGAII